MIAKKEIIDILKTIKYPGFSRDIVSFGIIKEIEINESYISLTISLKSNNQNVIKELKN